MRRIDLRDVPFLILYVMAWIVVLFNIFGSVIPNPSPASPLSLIGGSLLPLMAILSLLAVGVTYLRGPRVAAIFLVLILLVFGLQAALASAQIPRRLFMLADGSIKTEGEANRSIEFVYTMASSSRINFGVNWGYDHVSCSMNDIADNLEGRPFNLSLGKIDLGKVGGQFFFCVTVEDLGCKAVYRIEGSARKVGDSYYISADYRQGDLGRLDNFWNGAFWVLIGALVSILFDRAARGPYHLISLLFQTV